MNMNYFEYAEKLLNKSKTVFWFYSAMGVAEILNTESKSISFSDIEDNEIELSEKDFNKYNQGCDPDTIFMYED